MRAFIKIWGNDYRIDRIDWSDTKMLQVMFYDDDKRLVIINHKDAFAAVDAETYKHSIKAKKADLEKLVYWKEA